MEDWQAAERDLLATMLELDQLDVEAEQRQQRLSALMGSFAVDSPEPNNELNRNYSPDQLRDDRGRWTTGRGTGQTDETSSVIGVPSGTVIAFGSPSEKADAKYPPVDKEYWTNTWSSFVTNRLNNVQERAYGTKEDGAKVDWFRQEISSGHYVPPITTTALTNKETGKQSVVNGWHRLYAYYLEGRQPSYKQYPDTTTAHAEGARFEKEYSAMLASGEITRYNQVTNWDEHKHPRDSLGRFTFVIDGAGIITTDELGSNKLDRNNIKQVQQQIYDGLDWQAKLEFDLEGIAAQVYQNSGYRDINNAIRGKKITESVQQQIDKTNSSLRFSSNSPMTVYRGINSNDSRLADIKAGDELDADCFKSYSTNDKVANYFAAKNDQRYKVIITGQVKSGAVFGIPSMFSDRNWDESEVLFGTKTKTVVTDVRQEGDYIYINTEIG